jgi:hypothetical protein
MMATALLRQQAQKVHKVKDVWKLSSAGYGLAPPVLAADA